MVTNKYIGTHCFNFLLNSTKYGRYNWVSQKTRNPSLFLSSSFSHFLPISSNFTSIYNTLFWKIFCVFLSFTSSSNQSCFTITAINITQLPLTLWIIMMAAIIVVVHFTNGNRYTSIDCYCPCSLETRELRMQDYFILSSMDDNSCAEQYFWWWRRGSSVW